MKNYETLSEAINKLKAEEGYVHNFNLIDEHLALSEKEKFDSSEFEVDKILRFEGMPSSSDNAILYAITISNFKKGILIGGCGGTSGQFSDKSM